VLDIKPAIAFRRLLWPHLFLVRRALWDRWVEASQRGASTGAQAAAMLSCPPERRSGPRFGLGGVQQRNRDPRCRRHWPWWSAAAEPGPQVPSPLALAFSRVVHARRVFSFLRCLFLSLRPVPRELSFRVGCFIKVGDRGDDGGRLGRHPGFRATFDAGQEDPAQIGLPSGSVTRSLSASQFFKHVIMWANAWNTALVFTLSDAGRHSCNL
jgi:hypothetical protein